MKKRLLIVFISILFIGLLFLLAGCDILNEDNEVDTETINDSIAIPEPELKEEPIAEAEGFSQPKTELSICARNADCTDGKMCIDGSCLALQDIYQPVTDCARRCNYDSVSLTTSDGETYTLKKGEGSYSYAGALEWKVKSLPDYCESQEPKIALLFLKKNAGRILEETYVTLGAGDSTPVITHPAIKRVQFTVSADDINEVCG